MRGMKMICIMVAVVIVAAAVFNYKLGKNLANMSRCGCKKRN